MRRSARRHFRPQGTHRHRFQCARQCAPAAGRIEETALPGTPGNVGIAAHRDRFFRVLKDIKEGDALVLDTPVATEQYRVDWIKITSPEDVSVIDPTPGPAVTLVGCYSFYHVGSAPQRFIVRAVPAGSAAGGCKTPFTCAASSASTICRA